MTTHTPTFTRLTADQLLEDTQHTYPFVFLLSVDNTAIGADTLTGICDGLIDGYSELTEDPDGDVWLEARIDALASFADVAQALALAEAGEEVVQSLTEDELTALMHPKLGEVLEFDAWTREDVPLLLLATNYAPYNLDVFAPDGESIVWLNGADERRFILSLEKLGLGQLHVNEAAREIAELDLSEF